MGGFYFWKEITLFHSIYFYLFNFVFLFVSRQSVTRNLWWFLLSKAYFLLIYYVKMGVTTFPEGSRQITVNVSALCNQFLSKYNFKKEVLKPRGYWDDGKIAPRPGRLWTITGCGKMTQLATSCPVGTRGQEYFSWFVMNLNLTGLGVNEWLSPAKCCKTSLLSLCFTVHLTSPIDWRLTCDGIE